MVGPKFGISLKLDVRLKFHLGQNVHAGNSRTHVNLKMIKYLNVSLRNMWLWVRVLLQSLKFQIPRLLRARIHEFIFSCLLDIIKLQHTTLMLAREYTREMTGY